MRGTWIVAAVALAGSACSLVIGTSQYTLEDAGGGDDSATPDVATTADVEAPDVVDGGGPPDASVCTPSVACIAAASVCGTNCGVAYTTCTAGCKNPTCQNNCSNADTTCRNSCAAQCFQCTVDAGCPAQGDCDDASAK